MCDLYRAYMLLPSHQLLVNKSLLWASWLITGSLRLGSLLIIPRGLELRLFWTSISSPIWCVSSRRGWLQRSWSGYRTITCKITWWNCPSTTNNKRHWGHWPIIYWHTYEAIIIFGIGIIISSSWMRSSNWRGMRLWSIMRMWGSWMGSLGRPWKMDCIWIIRRSIGGGLGGGLGLGSCIVVFSRILGPGNRSTILLMFLPSFCLKWAKIMRIIRKKMRLGWSNSNSWKNVCKNA